MGLEVAGVLQAKVVGKVARVELAVVPPSHLKETLSRSWSWNIAVRVPETSSCGVQVSGPRWHSISGMFVSSKPQDISVSSDAPFY